MGWLWRDNAILFKHEADFAVAHPLICGVEHAKHNLTFLGINDLLHPFEARFTGITDPALLRASHIVPWAECESDALRLNVYNGLLLSSLWDAAFDVGLISFIADGTPLASTTLSESAALALGLAIHPVLHGLTPQHEALLKRHRAKHGVGR